MREILFMGKMKEDRFLETDHVMAGEWIYGDLKSHDEEFEGYTWINNLPVCSETVGEYTGFEDRRGLRIFEGHIVKLTVPRHKPQTAAVVFKYGSFMLSFVPCQEANGFMFLSRYDQSQLEVIGNIHDNPDLLLRSEKEAEGKNA
jgi:uncharacterized phage protein (TIGR01671 family)